MDIKYWTILISAGAAIFGGTIGAIVTIWVKRKEFEQFKEELKLKQKTLNQSIQENENKIQAELVRLKEIRNQYNLNFKELELKYTQFNHSQLEKVLQFASLESNLDKTKIQALSEFNEFLASIEANMPSYIEDWDQYEEWLVLETYFNLDVIINSLTRYLKKYPHVFILTNNKLSLCKTNAIRIKNSIEDLEKQHGEFEFKHVYSEFSPLLELHEGLQLALKEMKSDFEELELVRKEFIAQQVKLNHDPTTT